MALVDAEQWPGDASEAVYVAGRLREARRVEAVLTEAGVDYYVAPERFERMLFGVLRREYDGIAFHVLRASAGACVTRLRAAGLTAGLIEARDDGEAAGSPGAPGGGAE
jgi:hypothetical protein